MIMKILAVLLGLYIIADVIFLAATTDCENRICQIAKNTGALMSSLFLISTVPSEGMMVLGATIALFMWPETWFRALHYAEWRFPNLFVLYIQRYGFPFRRRVEHEKP